VPVAAKLRSTQPPVPATLYRAAAPDEAELMLLEPAGAVAPGQAAVLYDGDRLLGGGWIRRGSAKQPVEEGARHAVAAA
jgi:tRNA-specific 2-thiouridylase